MAACKLITDKKGRRFEAGKPFYMQPSVEVAEIDRTGNYVTVRFEPKRLVSFCPKPIIFHTDDLAAIVED